MWSFQGFLCGWYSPTKTETPVLTENHYSTRRVKHGINWHFLAISSFQFHTGCRKEYTLLRRFINSLVFRGKLLHIYIYPWLLPFKEKENKPQMLGVTTWLVLFQSWYKIYPFVCRICKTVLCVTSFLKSEWADRGLSSERCPHLDLPAPMVLILTTTLSHGPNLDLAIIHNAFGSPYFSLLSPLILLPLPPKIVSLHLQHKLVFVLLVCSLISPLPPILAQ